MKMFALGDVLSVTTGRLVSPTHMGGIYAILNFLTSDELFTHQLPRAATEVRPWVAAQFPKLMDDAPEMKPWIDRLEAASKGKSGDAANAACAAWVEEVRAAFGLPEMLPVYEMGADMHTHIDPLQEACAMFGDDKVIAVVANGNPHE